MGRMLKALQEVGASPGHTPRDLTRSELEAFGLWQLLEPHATAGPCSANEPVGQAAPPADAEAVRCDPLCTAEIDGPAIVEEVPFARARATAVAEADPFPEMPAWQCLNETLAELIGSHGFAPQSTAATVPESETFVAAIGVAECVIPAELPGHPEALRPDAVEPARAAPEPHAFTGGETGPAKSPPLTLKRTLLIEPGKHGRGEYLELADRILARVPPRQPASLVFTGTDSRHATAAMLADLAVAATERISGEVLVVDADFESPRMASQFGMDPETSLGDVLLDGADWSDAVRRTPTPRLSLLPGGRLLAADPRALRGMRLPRLLDQWQAQYQLVLLNASPGAYLAGLAGRVDGAYLVVHLHRTFYRAAAQAAAHLHKHGLHVLGCILTAADG